jgi:uncharacterized hydrophobic protein (TIGR00271 family)
MPWEVRDVRHQQQVVAPSMLVDRLNDGARSSRDYIVLVVASSAIATFGLLENNAAVIIGAMIIAPLIFPIQALSFGAIAGNRQLLRRAALSVAIGTILSIVVAAILELLVSLPTLGSEILARSKPTLMDLGIALAAGAVSGFATVRPSISSTIAGTAIAVALMPPICVIGIALASGKDNLALGAFLLYATNLFGITLACMIVFRLAGHVKSADRTAFATAAVLTAAVAVPLGAGLIELLRFDRLESTLSSALRTQTVTFKHVELVQMRVDWLKSPPVATLTVRSTQPITPAQVSDLERFAQLRTGHRFTLVFEVTPLVEVRGATPSPN